MTLDLFRTFNVNATLLKLRSVLTVKKCICCLIVTSSRAYITPIMIKGMVAMMASTVRNGNDRLRKGNGRRCWFVTFKGIKTAFVYIPVHPHEYVFFDLSNISCRPCIFMTFKTKYTRKLPNQLSSQAYSK